MRAALGLVAIALACGAPQLARGQDDGGGGARHRHCPSCGQDLPARRCPTCGQGRQLSDEDRELDRVLRREYGDPNGPAPRRRIIETPPPEPVPPPPPRVDPSRRAPSDDDDDRDFYVHMGVLGAHWAASLTNARVSSARGGFHGDNVRLSGGQLSGADLDGLSNTQIFRGWIDLGPWFSFDGGANRSFFRDTGQLTRDFVFRGQQFSSGQVIETKFNALVADFNFVVHPVHGRWGRLDLYLGLRYMYAQAQFRDTGAISFGREPGVDVIVTGGGGAPLFIPASGFAASGKVRQTNEAVIPMVGVGGSFRPVNGKEIAIELFGRARVGGFDWVERGYSYRRDRWVDRRFYAYSAELDGGVSLILFGTLGVTAGYHFDLAHIERRDMGESDSSDWNAHGPYMGAFLQF